jgi:hypothetical protein
MLHAPPSYPTWMFNGVNNSYKVYLDFQEIEGIDWSEWSEFILGYGLLEYLQFSVHVTAFWNLSVDEHFVTQMLKIRLNLAVNKIFETEHVSMQRSVLVAWFSDLWFRSHVHKFMVTCLKRKDYSGSGTLWFRYTIFYCRLNLQTWE